MFTGIITDIGRIRRLERAGDLRARIGTAYRPDSIDIGASIACDGICLTVIDRGADAEGPWFEVEMSAETLARTTAGAWAVGRRVNLERALRVGDELGGHIVTGHVDGVARVLRTEDEGESTRVRFAAPPELAGFLAPKGSVALNGTSLTVNEVAGAEFGVNLIPHTKRVTTWGAVRAGDAVNLEVDTLARYVARLREWSP
jgi:riboflavin synthase